MAAIKEELIQADQELSIGIITSAVSSKVLFLNLANYSCNYFVLQWKSLTDSERSVYEDLAKKDRERYDHECEVTRNAIIPWISLILLVRR
jgi:hypothetical protein